ncbi:MAG: hypothetical protein R2725_03220 [Solirubrobacterales bacterium]
MTISLAVGALLALVGASLAFAAKPVTVRQGNLKLKVNGNFFPQKLPKKKFAGVGLKVSSWVSTVDGTHPPALKEFNVETDKNGYIDTTGYPKCKSGQLQARTTDDALKVCKQALVGKGKTTVEVEFADQPPIDVNSELLVFNGGTKGGKTTLYVHAYFNAPITGAIVTTVKTKKIHKGPYGTLATSRIPEIGNGAGSVTFFTLTINKKFTYKGKKRSVLNARCANGKLRARGEATFYDDSTKIKNAEVLRPCTPKG